MAFLPHPYLRSNDVTGRLRTSFRFEIEISTEQTGLSGGIGFYTLKVPLL